MPVRAEGRRTGQEETAVPSGYQVQAITGRPGTVIRSPKV